MTVSAIERIERRLGPGVHVASGPLLYGAADLLEPERAPVERAVQKRVREFATGRVLARRLLAELGHPGTPLLREPTRAPAWPAGIVGSISHTEASCVVLAARKDEVAALGVDVEGNTPLEDNLFALVLTAREREVMDRHPPARRGDLAKIIFSAKECFYKCQYSTTETFLDFADVEIELDLDARTFHTRVLHAQAKVQLERAGRHPAEGLFEVDQALIVTAMAWRAAAPPRV